MPALARGQASDCSNPELDLFTKVNGVLTDVAELEFVIEEDVTSPGTPIQVFPLAGRQAVNVTDLCPVGEKLGTGHFVAVWTPELTEPIGTHIVRWFFKLTPTSPEQTFSEEFQVLAEATGSSSVGYCTVQDLRDEGVPEPPAFGGVDDATLQKIISRVTQRIDKMLGRFFEPRSMVIRVDGTGRRGLLLGDPIIAINSIRLISDDFTPATQTIEIADVRIYNRHLTQRLFNPDDRENPRIEFLEFDTRHEHTATFMHDSAAHHLFHPHRWPEGTQNVELDGVFGYTDPDGSPYGRTPEDIRRAACLMALKEIPGAYSDPDKASDAANAWRVTEVKTRDQTIKWADPSKLGTAGIGVLTGDPTVDRLLVPYMRPPMFGAV